MISTMSNCITIIFIASLPIALPRGPEYNVAILKERHICPDVVPIEDCPGERVELSWKMVSVDFGVPMYTNDVLYPPFRSYWPVPKPAFFVLIFTDPDAPTGGTPPKREYLHWLVANIDGHDLQSGETLVDYVGPIPEHMNGAHRMVFLVYKQPGLNYVRFDEEHLPLEQRYGFQNRGNFSSTKFAKWFNLTGPVAANFFMAHWTQDMVQNLSKPTTSTTLDPRKDWNVWNVQGTQSS